MRAPCKHARTARLANLCNAAHPSLLQDLSPPGLVAAAAAAGYGPKDDWNAAAAQLRQATADALLLAQVAQVRGWLVRDWQGTGPDTMKVTIVVVSDGMAMLLRGGGALTD